MRKRISRIASNLILLVTVVWPSGCVYLRSTREPIPSRTHYVREGERSERLMVMLPGRGETGDSYVRRGFIKRAIEMGVDADWVTVDAHLGYYYRRILQERLKRDIVVPAQEVGYKEIWFVGISLGGMGSLMYTGFHPEDVTGMLLLAPFVGDSSSFFDEIEAAGGPAVWPPSRPESDRKYEQLLWFRIREIVDRDGANANIYVGYGTEDRYARGMDLFAQLIPDERVVTTDGGHTWSVWTPLWEELLRRSGLAPASAGSDG